MSCLHDGDRRAPGAGRAAQLRVGEDQSELAHAVARQFGRVEVLDDEHAMAGVQDLWDLEWPVRVLGWDRAVAPGVAARERHASPPEPARELASGARLTREVGLGVAPVLAPARVEEHRVAWRRIDVRHADDVARAQWRDVDEPAACDDLGHRLDAEPGHSGGACELADAPAVVAAIADLQVAQ